MWYRVPKFAPTASGPPSLPRAPPVRGPDGGGVVPGRVSPVKNAPVVAPGAPAPPVRPIEPIAPVDVAVFPDVVGAVLPAPPSRVSSSAATWDGDASELPHAEQNVSVARAGIPQRGQFIGTTANYPANPEGAQMPGVKTGSPAARTRETADQEPLGRRIRLAAAASVSIRPWARAPNDEDSSVTDSQ